MNRANILPTACLPTGLNSVQDFGDAQSVCESGLSLPLFSDRFQEMMSFDGLQIVVTEPGASSGIESFVKRVLGSAHEPGISFVRGILVREKNIQFVHALEVPVERPGRTLDFERPVAFMSLDDAADFQISVSAIRKLNQGANIVLVGDIAECAARSRTTPNESFPVPDRLLHRT